MQPVLLKYKCAAQKEICTAIKACLAGAIVYVDDEDEPLGGKIVFDLDRCNGCGKCAEVCCGDAIEMGENQESVG